MLIIIGLIVWLKRDTKNEKHLADAIQAEEKIKEAEIVAEEILPAQQNPLALAEECLHREDAKLFYTHLNQGLKNFLAKKLALLPEELNRKNIAGQLDAKGISNETAMQLQSLIDEIEWQLYTPFADKEKMKSMYERGNELIQLVNMYRI